MKLEKCIHYIACDSKKYCIEAEISALNFRKNCTDTYFILYTDVNFSSSVFNEIVKIPNLIPNGHTAPGWSEGRFYFTLFRLFFFFGGVGSPFGFLIFVFNIIWFFVLSFHHHQPHSAHFTHNATTISYKEKKKNVFFLFLFSNLAIK